MKSAALLTLSTATFLLGACTTMPAATPLQSTRMVIVDEADVTRDEAPPHGKIGMSTAYRISDVAHQRNMEFRKRSLHVGAAVGEHIISHDEVYYVVSGTGVVISDGEEATLTEGMAAYLYEGANVGIRQTGNDPLVIIISYPLKARRPLQEVSSQ